MALVELLRTTDPVLISFVEAELAEQGIETVVLDMPTSVLEGSLGILPRRVMVADEQAVRARRILEEAQARIADGGPPGT